MKTNDFKLTTKSTARAAGATYLLIILAGLFGGLFVRETLIDPLNSDKTLTNLLEHAYFFRWGFLADLIMVISDIAISILFYQLFKNVNKTLAMAAMLFRLIQSGVLVANLINLIKPILMIRGASDLSASSFSELGTDVMLQLELFEMGYLISGVFFSINCVLMGRLFIKSKAFPNFLGFMMYAAGIGYLFNCMANFIAPSLIEVSSIVMFFTAVISELTCCFYLLIKGIRS